MDYCPHTVLGHKRKLFHSLCSIAKLKFASILMVLLYEISRIFTLKTLRNHWFTWELYISSTPCSHSHKAFLFPTFNFTWRVGVPFPIWFSVSNFATVRCRLLIRLPLIITWLLTPCLLGNYKKLPFFHSFYATFLTT